MSSAYPRNEYSRGHIRVIGQRSMARTLVCRHNREREREKRIFIDVAILL